MSQHETDGSYAVPGEQPWDRVRHFHDGRQSVTEWQCSDCQLWYPVSTMHGISFTKAGRSQPWCYSCRPPKSGLLRHLHQGGGVLISFGGFTEWIKKNAAEQRARGLQRGASS